MKSPKSLGSKLFMLIVMGALLPMILLSAIQFRSAGEAIVHQQEHHLSGLLHSNQYMVRETVDDVVKSLTAFAATPTVIEHMVNYQRGLKSAEGPFVGSTRWEIITELYATDLQAFVKTYGYDDAFLASLDGAVLYSAKSSPLVGRNFLQNPAPDALQAALRDTIRAGTWSFGDFVALGGETRSLGFFVQLIRDDYGDAIGFLIASVPLEDLWNDSADRTRAEANHRNYMIGDDTLLRAEVGRQEGVSLFTREATELVDQWLRMPNRENGRGVYTGKYVSRDGTPVFASLTPIRIGSLNYALVSEVPTSHVFHLRNDLAWTSMVFVLITAFVIAVVAYLISKRVVTPLGQLTCSANKMAVGSLDVQEHRFKDSEFIKLDQSFQTMQSALQAIDYACEELADGHCRKPLKPRSVDDSLTRNINRIAREMQAVVEQANAIRDHDFSPRLPVQSEDDELSQSLNEMARGLQSEHKLSSDQQWVMKSWGDLSEIIHRRTTPEDFCQRVLGYITYRIDANVGAGYIVSGDDIGFHLRAKSATDQQEAILKYFDSQDEQFGAFFRSTKLAEYDNFPAPLFFSQPSEISDVIVMPLLHEGETVSLIMLGLRKPLADRARQFLQLALEPLSLGLSVTLMSVEKHANAGSVSSISDYRA